MCSFSKLIIGIGIRTSYKKAVFYRGEVALVHEEDRTHALEVIWSTVCEKNGVNIQHLSTFRDMFVQANNWYVWDTTSWSSRFQDRYFKGICRIYRKSVKKNRKITTCNWLDLGTLGSWPIMSRPVMPKNLSGHWSRLPPKGRVQKHSQPNGEILWSDTLDPASGVQRLMQSHLNQKQENGREKRKEKKRKKTTSA